MSTSLMSEAPRGATSAALTIGALLAAVCFGVAVVAEILGADPGDGDMADLAAVVDGLAAFTPWAWAALGAYLVLLTPAAGLVVTAWEYWGVRDRRAVLLALAVLAVLGVSTLLVALR